VLEGASISGLIGRKRVLIACTVASLAIALLDTRLQLDILSMPATGFPLGFFETRRCF